MTVLPRNIVPCRINLYVLLLLLALITIGCKPSHASVPPARPPAKVDHVAKEETLANIVLTPEAEQRLGVETAAVIKKKVTRTRTFGGELLVALGRNQKPSIYSILPGLTAPDMIRVAEMQVDSDGQIAAAKVQLQAAEIALKRAESLVADKAGSIRAVDEAKAQVETAKAALGAAQARRELMGAPLFDAIQQDALWVRVPVYVGDIDQIDTAAPAQVGLLGAPANQATRSAKPIQVPVSASNGSATVDLFYEVANADRSLRSGQKVALRVPLKSEEESLVVPASAIFYDIYGGTWIYENTAPHGFTRRRIEVRYIADREAVLARGPSPGTKIVTTAVAELFGTEFGFSK